MTKVNKSTVNTGRSSAAAERDIKTI